MNLWIFFCRPPGAALGFADSPASLALRLHVRRRFRKVHAKDQKAVRPTPAPSRESCFDVLFATYLAYYGFAPPRGRCQPATDARDGLIEPQREAPKMHIKLPYST